MLGEQQLDLVQQQPRGDRPLAVRAQLALRSLQLASRCGTRPVGVDAALECGEEGFERGVGGDGLVREQLGGELRGTSRVNNQTSNQQQMADPDLSRCVVMVQEG